VAFLILRLKVLVAWLQSLQVFLRMEGVAVGMVFR